MALSSVGLSPEVPPLLSLLGSSGSLTLDTALPMETCLNSRAGQEEILVQGQTSAGSVWGRNAGPTSKAPTSALDGAKS